MLCLSRYLMLSASPGPPDTLVTWQSSSLGGPDRGEQLAFAHHISGSTAGGQARADGRSHKGINIILDRHRFRYVTVPVNLYFHGF